MKYLRLCLLLLPVSLLAQETRGMISGVVLDPQGSAVAGANVTVTNTDTNVSVSLVANSTGYYEANLLTAGNYKVTAGMPGFRQSVRSGIRLPVGSKIEVDIPLEIGVVSESVSVDARAPLVDANTASSGRTIDERSLRDLPMMGNQPTLLVQLVPGMNDPGYVSYTVPGYTIANSRAYEAGNVGGNTYSIDGAPNDGLSRRIAFVPLGDTIEEFRVETSNFDATVGHTVGASIAMMTKSGGNQFHGSATELYSNEQWNAASFFTKQLYYRSIAAANASGDTAGAAKIRSDGMTPPGQGNKFGVSVGGPVLIPKVYNGRNRFFFFFSYNGLRDRKHTAPGNELFTVPTSANRTGDFSGLLKINPQYQIYDPLSVRTDPARAGHYIRDPFPGNIIQPSRVINPAYQAYLKIVPQANNDPQNPLSEPVDNLNNARGPWNIDYNAYSNRLDYQISNKHRLFGRWSYNNFLEDEDDWTWSTARGLQSSQLSRPSISATADWVFTPTPTMMFDVSVSGTGYKDGGDKQVAQSYKPGDVGLPAYLDAKAGDYHSLPSMSWSGYQGLSTGYGAFTRVRQYTGKVDFSYVRNNHSLRAGFDQRQYYRTNNRSGNLSGSFAFTNQYTRRNDDTFTAAGNLGLSWAAFMLGIPTTMSISDNDTYATHNPAYGAYVQDNWRLTKNLSINIGLRWELEDGPTERYNRQMSTFDPAAQLPITAAAQAAYAANPVPEEPASQFMVLGGSMYAGVKGADRRLWNSQVTWMPRLSFAYKINDKTAIRGGYGIYYDTLNVMNFAPDQTGYSRTTTTNLTNDFGVTWLAGNPGAGVAPIADPFPVRADGTRFDAPVQNALGLMAKAGAGWTYNSFDPARPRVQRWRLSLQRQFGSENVIDVAYAGTYIDTIPVSIKQDFLPQQFWASAQTRNDAIPTNLNANVTNPFYIGNFASLQQSDPVIYQQMSTLSFFSSRTIAKNRLLRAFPQMNGLSQANQSVGRLYSNALELQFTHRFSKGFNLSVGYTETRAYEKTFIANEFESSPQTYYPSQNARPHRFTATSVIEFPFGKGRRFLQSGPLNWVLGGWQTAITYEWQPGPYLIFPNLFFTGDPDSIKIDSPSINQWFNTSGFVTDPAKQPAAYQTRVFPMIIPDVTGPGLNMWQANLLRQFRLGENKALEFRVDALNLLNRSQFSSPNTTPSSTNFGKLTSIYSEAINRSYQLQVRVRF